jgi:basic amino acid/polyamine antiporter, APA family
VLPVTVSALPDRTFQYGNVYNELLEYVIPVDVLFYTLMVGAVVALRLKAPRLPRPYRTIGYPLPVITYITLAILLVLDFIYLKPRTSGKGFVIVLAGIPVYLIWSRVAARGHDQEK